MFLLIFSKIDFYMLGKEAQNLNQKDFTELLNMHRNRIFGFIYSLVQNRDAAEDIFQNVSTILWRKFSEFEQGSNFSAWAMTIARFSVLQWREKQARLPLLLEKEELFDLAEAATTVSLNDQARRDVLIECVQNLPKKHQELLWKRYICGESATEIAQSSNQSVRAIYKRLSKIRLLLLDCVRKKLNVPLR